MNTLNEVFEHVKSIYFPRWDRKKHWKIVYGVDPQHENGNLWDGLEMGSCNTRTKIIYVNPMYFLEEIELIVLVIHEICHAVVRIVRNSHGKLFQDRMTQVSVKAFYIGQIQLSHKIMDDFYYLETCEDLEIVCNGIQFLGRSDALITRENIKSDYVRNKIIFPYIQEE